MVHLTPAWAGMAALCLMIDIGRVACASLPAVKAGGTNDWRDTLSQDTLHRLNLAQQHLDDQSTAGQAFRNDTIMRVNIEREALDLSLIDLSQAFGWRLPAARDQVASVSAVSKRSEAEVLREEGYTRSGRMYNSASVEKRNDAEILREEGYTRSGRMYNPAAVEKRNDAEVLREEGYTRSGRMYKPVAEKRNDAEVLCEEGYTRSGRMYKPVIEKRNDAEVLREEGYTRSGRMYKPATEKRNDAEVLREEGYTRSGRMYKPVVEKRNDAEVLREEGYTRSGRMYSSGAVEKRDDAEYSRLLDRKNLALGAIERINVAYRIQHKPEITMDQANEMASHGDEYMTNYWQTSLHHGGFWTGDQVEGKPNFIEGGQVNGFGFIQSTFHKLHCLANLRTMLASHITGNGNQLTGDMNAHAMHCLEYIRQRELAQPDLYQEPIDTVDYKGMGIH